MGRPLFDFARLDLRSKECYDNMEQVGSQLRSLAARAEQGGAVPRSPLQDSDTLVTKVSTLRKHAGLSIPTIAYVDPIDDNRKAFEEAFQQEFHVITVATRDDAMQLLSKHHVDILISDLALCKEVKQRFPRVIRALISSYTDVGDANAAMAEAQVRCFIPKPWQHDRVIQLLREVLLSNTDATIIG